MGIETAGPAGVGGGCDCGRGLREAVAPQTRKMYKNVENVANNNKKGASCRKEPQRLEGGSSLGDKSRYLRKTIILK